MRIVLRCDIGAEHGLGHGVRMRALAQELATHGANVSFVTTTPALEAFVAPFPCQTRSEKCLPLNADVFVVDTKEPWIQAVLETLQARHGNKTKVVRIDHPHTTPDSCDVLIGPCVHWPTETVSALRAAFGDRFLYGWDYVMLAPEVTQQQPIPYEQRRQGPIVFCAGGSDPSGALTKMWQWTQGLALPTEAHFVIGTAFSEKLGIERPWFDSSSRRMPTGVFPPHTYRAELRRAAMAVSLFGITIYESVWYRTPLLMLAHTEENLQGAVYLGQAISTASFSDALSFGNGQEYLCEGIRELWESEQDRTARHHAATGLIDGRGTARVAEAILGL
ncbi:MAG TPA: hypothetical protein VI542_07450 [Candidatus Tectomicrobia bacterium]